MAPVNLNETISVTERAPVADADYFVSF